MRASDALQQTFQCLIARKGPYKLSSGLAFRQENLVVPQGSSPGLAVKPLWSVYTSNQPLYMRTHTSPRAPSPPLLLAVEVALHTAATPEPGT